MVEKLTPSEVEHGGLIWRKSQFSMSSGHCVEIASTDGKIAVRNSKDPYVPILVYTPAEFSAFLEGARNGELDDFGR
jgi:hypothetical protein